MPTFTAERASDDDDEAARVEVIHLASLFSPPSSPSPPLITSNSVPRVV